MILAIFVVVLMTAASLGGGAMVLRLLGAWQDADLPERAVFSFAVGVGVIGWVGFFLALGGALNGTAVFGLLAAMTPGLIFLRGGSFFSGLSGFFSRGGLWGWYLLGGLALVLFFNVLEGISPPADADSLTYHFALPKQFLSQEALVFAPLAVENAIPLLLQMTYAVALSAGGELAMTLWTMVTGWGAAAMIYCITRRHLDLTWSLLAVLLFMTTPAVIYGAGTGQVEVRTAMFMIVAAAAVAEAVRTGLLRYAVIAGLTIGFFVASKYTGLVFGCTVGLALLFQRRWLAMGATCGLAILVAGSQWYIWNWWNTGDPVFPMLYGIIDYRADVPWNAAQAVHFSKIFAVGEKAVPANLLWLFLYPFKATLFPAHQFESLRTGLGPYALLILPVALAGAWAHRDRVRQSPLFLFAAIAFTAYGIWFLFGTSQRIRHFLPLYPLLLIPLTVAVQLGTEKYRCLLRPTALACAAVLLIQLGGHGLFTMNYARHVFTGESRDAFLARNIAGFPATQWINKKLSNRDRVMVTERNLVYLMDVPVFYAHEIHQAIIEIRPDSRDPNILWQQMRHEGITHILSPSPTGENGQYAPLIALKCLKSIKQFQIERFTSRTLPSLKADKTDWTLLRLRPDGCGLGSE